jgi:hypothetical protein
MPNVAVLAAESLLPQFSPKLADVATPFDHRIRNAEDFEIRRNYIHQNPVHSNLASSPELYPFSSAFISA